ncbi:DNA-binding transcriptional regulator, LysR family [Paraburkholderia fungorum]|uniref:DNA-binding transcriptional regulator, LysR family n=1 Tax=Paraburkholderia fungorum TaxID=134537 RepID=A0A1H1JVE3_9BURK|nr:LysR family transcriptional regulator [Paraburkholderia fungorum]SDR53822.1 DNA-binding transcriptional regulator, LysR family [Paraburkholderia fungorum]
MQLDMNLLVAFDALLEAGSVGGAAHRMHVSSPAMSRTLDRIRHMTGDAIMVRAGRTMMPTPYAESVREEIHAIVTRAHAVMAQQRSFDPVQIERIFTVQCHDALACVLGQRLLGRLRTTAPGAKLRLVAEAGDETPALRQNEVDLHLGAATPTQPDVMHAVLGHDTLTVAMHARHPLAGRRLNAERYATAEHITVSRRGRLRDPVDDALSALDLKRRVVASAPTAAAGLCMASNSDLMVVVPIRACAEMAKALRLHTVPLPVSVPLLPVISTWHARYNGDRAHAWLREEVVNVVKSLLA